MNIKLTPILLLSLSTLTAHRAIAQVIPDNTLPVNSQITPIPNGVIINNGTQSGTNLFHSFSSFSLPRDEVAIFNNNQNIYNIITRVTGTDSSLIKGIIQANGKANLLFINPNGIVFGSEARLLIGGAFLGTTANNFIFPHGQLFGRNTPDINLVIHTPIGVDFSNSSGAIRVDNIGHNLIQESLFSPINRSQKPFGLQTTPGATLALMGNGIVFDGGVSTVNGGHLAIVSVRYGSVPIEISDNQINFNISQLIDRSDIILANQSLLDGVFFGNSSISLYGANIKLSDGSLITTQNLGVVPDKNISIDATNLIFEGIDPRSQIQSGLLSESLNLGNASNIEINSKTILLSDGGGIGTIAYAQGATGLISISSQESSTISGNTLLVNNTRNSVIGSINLGTGVSQPIIINSPKLTLSNLGSITSVTGLSARGADLKITSQSLRAETGGLMYVTSLNSGRLGDININTQDLELNGSAPNFDESNLGLVITSTNIENLSGIFTNSTGSNSESSNISINTDNLNIIDGALIGSISLGMTDSSSINIKANEILISGSSPSHSLSQIASRTLASGNANTIDIEAKTIKIADGGTINTSTTSTGNAGNITLRASESITLNSLKDTSSISASASILDPNLAQLVGVLSVSPTGQGGEIGITTPTLTLNPNSSITARHEGLGLGGNLVLNVDSLWSNQGNILTTTLSGNGGNITLNSQSALLNQSMIATSSTKTGNGGNININSNFLGLFNNTQIEANAFEGDGGNIFVNSNAFFSDRSSQVTTTSELGKDGRVNGTETPFTLSTGFTKPPSQQSLEEIAALSCLNYQQKKRAIKFTEEGQGGDPSSPSQPRGYTLDELIAIDPEQVVAGIRDKEGQIQLLNCEEYWEYWKEQQSSELEVK
jgi:filamentous hemagglutinin family protein